MPTAPSQITKLNKASPSYKLRCAMNLFWVGIFAQAGGCRHYTVFVCVYMLYTGCELMSAQRSASFILPSLVLLLLLMPLLQLLRRHTETASKDKFPSVSVSRYLVTTGNFELPEDVAERIIIT